MVLDNFDLVYSVLIELVIRKPYVEHARFIFKHINKQPSYTCAYLDYAKYFFEELHSCNVRGAPVKSNKQ